MASKILVIGDAGISLMMLDKLASTSGGNTKYRQVKTGLKPSLNAPALLARGRKERGDIRKHRYGQDTEEARRRNGRKRCLPYFPRAGKELLDGRL
jgi:hypothetical protein